MLAHVPRTFYRKSSQMLELFTWGTPNGHKVHILLEECGTAYRIHPANINDKEAFAAQISPLAVNRKIPLLIDTEANDGRGLTISESGAILIYLAEKHGSFLPADVTGRYAAMQWLMFQMSAVGPMMGQLNHFRSRTDAHDNAYVLERFGIEVRRIHGVMEQHLSQGHEWFAGAEYSIADMAIFPWLRLSEKLGQPWSAHPQLHRWYERILTRPAVQRALHIPHLTATAKV